MPTAVVIAADLIRSKKRFSQPGGYHDIVQLCSTMRSFIDVTLKQLTNGLGITISSREPQGDDIAFQLVGATFSELADISVATTIRTFLKGQGGRDFRFILFTLELDGTYHPRMKEFGEISKTEAGSMHHLAVERRIISYVNKTICRWLEAVPHEELHVPLRGESHTGSLFDLYCKVEDSRTYKLFRWKLRSVPNSTDVDDHSKGRNQSSAPLTF